MAQAFLNPAFKSVNGRIGRVVFYSFNDKTYFRAYVLPRNPNTPAQRSNRGLFGLAMKAWQSLSSFDRDSFNRRAKRLAMTGHNLFISRYMRAHADTGAQEPAGDEAAPVAGIPRANSSCAHSIGHSVSPGMTGRDGAYAVYTGDVPLDGG